MVLAPVVRGRKGEYGKLLEELRAEGFTRVKVDGELRRLEEEIVLDKKYKHDISVVVDRLVMTAGPAQAARRLGRDRGRARRGHRRDRDACRATARGRASRTLLASASPACTAAPRCPSSSRGSSPSTRRTAPARAAPASARRWRSTPSWSCPTRRCRSTRARSCRGRRGASSYYEQLTQAIAERVRRSTSTRPGRTSPRSERELLPLRHRRRAHLRLLPQPLRPPALVHDALRGHRPEPRAPLRGDRLDWSREQIEELHGRCGRARSARARGCGRSRSRSRSAGSASTSSRAVGARRALEWLEELELTDTERAIARLILREIDERLRFLDNVGVGYLSLERAAATLSGGEAQRIRLATQIGSSPGRRALHPRRAVDRPAPARQRAADRARSSACATSATP